MTKQDFQFLCQDLLLLDGATGSCLMEAGMPKGVCTESWILEHPDIFIQLQRSYVDAGSKVIYAPTFSTNRISLSLHGLENQQKEMIPRLVGLSKEAGQGRAYVAGDLTTTGKMMAPMGDLTYEQAFSVYCEQIQLLADAGVDLLIAETMINVEEALAAVDAANSVCDLPILCTMTVEADGSIFTGGNAFEAAVALEAAGADAVGINCSVGPDQLTSIVKNISENVSVPVIAKPNAGMPHISDQGIAVYDMTPEEFAAHMEVLVQNGAKIIGGCCGTSPVYIRETAKRLAL